VLDLLAEGFASGRVIDALMVLLAVEGLILIAVRRHRGLGSAAWMAALIVVPGLLLMLAVKLALINADWRLIAVTLAAAGAVHAADVAHRLRG
jgi:uncharacterized membrane protein YhaH (DUF805 family)